jgi:peptide/nickel transport system substrate-binding protein
VRWRRSVGGLTVVLALALALAAPIADVPNATARTSTAVDPNGTVRIATTLVGAAAGGLHLDPAKSATPEFDYPWQVAVYAGLLRRTSRGGLEPSLATKATIVDPQTIDVELRPGVTFSDGTPFNAQAVKLGVERNKANAGAQFRAEFQNLARIDTTGDLSLRLTLDQPVAGAFYELLGGQEFFIVSPTAVANGVDLDKSPVGAGPFTLTQYVTDQKMTFAKNRKYWDAAHIKLAGIEFINSDPGAPTVTLLKSGGADYAQLSVSDAASFRGSDFKIRTAGNPDAMFWFPTCKTIKPLDDVRVRKALNFAIDRDSLNKALFDGTGQPQWALWPKENQLFPTDLDHYFAYNPRKAKALLKAAGLSSGFDVSVVVPNASPQLQLMAQVVQAQWAKVGARLKIVTTANYVQDLYLDHRGALGLNPTIRSGLVHLTGPFVPGSIGNLCGYSNQELNAIADQLKALAPGAPEAVALWKKAQDFVVKDQALAIFGVFGPVVTASVPRLGGVEVVTGAVTNLDYWKAYMQKG